MAKFVSEFAVGFVKQTVEGTFPASLAAIDAAWGIADGLILGSAGAGQKQSGIDLSLEREREDSPFIGSSFTRSLSTILSTKGSVRAFSFAFPFVGNRADASTPVVAADLTPITGFDALLKGAGLVGLGIGQTWLYAFGGDGLGFGALVYANGNRYQIVDCRCSLSIDFTPRQVPIATATIVGILDDQKKEGDVGYAAFPVLTYGAQQSVKAPTTKAVGHGWGDTRGFSAFTLNITPEFTAFPDGNATEGEVNLQENRETSITATLFADDTTDKGYEYAQLVETDQANLDLLTFQVGATATDGNPAEAVAPTIPDPELVDLVPVTIGDRAAATVQLQARGVGGNDELQLAFV